MSVPIHFLVETLGISRKAVTDSLKKLKDWGMVKSFRSGSHNVYKTCDMDLTELGNIVTYGKDLDSVKIEKLRNPMYFKE